MKKAILYVIVFAAIQMGASSIVMALWKIITGSADVTAPMLIVSMTLFSVGVLAVFLLAKWCVLSPNYLRMRQWGVFIWCVLAALGAIIETCSAVRQLGADTPIKTSAFTMASDSLPLTIF